MKISRKITYAHTLSDTLKNTLWPEGSSLGKKYLNFKCISSSLWKAQNLRIGTLELYSLLPGGRYIAFSCNTSYKFQHQQINCIREIATALEL